MVDVLRARLVLPSGNSVMYKSFRNMHLYGLTEKSFSSCHREVWPLTLTFKPDLDSVEINERVKYLSKVIVRGTDTQIALIAPPDH